MFKISKNKDIIYPSSIKRVVWNITQYHFSENVMIGGTESKVETKGADVVELTEVEALSLIDKFKNTYPKIPKEDLSFLPLKKEGLNPSRTGSS